VQQATTPRAPTAPQAPRTTSPDVIGGVPRTGEEFQSLRIKIDQLREQLQDAASRRSNIAGQLRTADQAARAGIESRMGELDSRILQIERELTTSSMQLAQAPASARIAGTQAGVPHDIDPFANRIVSEIVPIVAILSVFVLGPFAIAMARLIWKRASNLPAPRAAVVDQATQQRLEQLQQSVDTIAIEVERISEGQRFVTKLLSERSAVGAGAAEPVRAAKKAALPSERG
jgi:hypothetical protein